MRTKRTQGGFTVLEMLIVILVLAALAVSVLPTIDLSERFINDTMDDYNQASALRYVSMYKSLNELYPAGFHTGLQDDGGGGSDFMDLMSLDCAYLYMNHDGNGTTNATAAGAIVWDGVNRFPWQVSVGANAADSDVLLLSEAWSLAKVGIVALAYGDDPFVEMDEDLEAMLIDPDSDIVTGALWDETAGTSTIGTTNLTLGGQLLSDLVPAATADRTIVLWVGTEIVWDYYYDAGGQTAFPLTPLPDPEVPNTWTGESRIGIEIVPRDPKMSRDAWRFYACLFRVDADLEGTGEEPNAEPAQFLGTLSPQLIALNP